MIDPAARREPMLVPREVSYLSNGQFCTINAFLEKGIDLTYANEDGTLYLRDKVCFEYVRVYPDGVQMHCLGRTEPLYDLNTNGSIKVRYRSGNVSGSSLLWPQDIKDFEDPCGEVEC